MTTLRLLFAFCLLPYCLGSGGAASSGGAAAGTVGSSEVPDNVKIIYTDKPFTIVCNNTLKDADSDTYEYEYEWYKNGAKMSASEGVFVYVNGTLHLSSATEEDIGNYTCKADDGGPTETYTAIMISYRNLPKSGTAIEGDKLTLKCEAKGAPQPTFVWKKDNVSIEDAVEGDRLSFHGDGNATMEISDTQQTERGEYTCYISNYEGLVFTTSTHIRIKDIYAALWPFLGIVAEVVILCLVIFIYEKRRSKNDFEESDTDQGGSTKGRN